MNTADSLGMIDLTEVVWPISWRYTIRGPFGDTRETLSANVPELQGDLSSSAALGVELWRRAVAAATSAGCTLLYVETMCWRGSLAPIVTPVGTVTGVLQEATGDREQQACVVLHSGHYDRYAKRRLVLAGTPQAWVSDGLLTRGARGALEALGQAMIMGMCNHLTGAPMVWLIEYPGVLSSPVGNLYRVAFRRVEFVRVCWHTTGAPLPASGPWPG